MYELPLHPTRKNYKQITNCNPKIEKTNRKMNVLGTVWHGLPGDLSGYEMCRFADLCRTPCLNTAGAHYRQWAKNIGRMRRTLMFIKERPKWEVDYLGDLCIQQAKANDMGITAVHRPNGTTDIPWERVKFKSFGNKTVFELMPNMQFMDYTKYPFHIRHDDKLPPNYHLCFSVSGSDKNRRWAMKSLEMGRNITIVLAVRRGQPMPEYLWGLPVIDGDEHDLRFLDPNPCVVGLRAKGKAIGDISGFVHNPHTGTPIHSIEEWVDVDKTFGEYQFAKRAA